MSLLSRLRSAFAAEQFDEDAASQKRDVLSHPMVQAGLWSISTGYDIVPGGFGGFGRMPTNPIPVNGVSGEFVYLNRLRCPSGVGFMYHRVGSLHSEVTKNPVDLYEMVSVDGTAWESLYFDCYFERRSILCPEGLSLMPWGSLNKNLKVIIKMPLWGTNGCVENFPFGLPSAIANDPEMKSLSPGLALAFSRRLENIIEGKPKETWRRP